MRRKHRIDINAVDFVSILPTETGELVALFHDQNLKVSYKNLPIRLQKSNLNNPRIFTYEKLQALARNDNGHIKYYIIMQTMAGRKHAGEMSAFTLKFTTLS